MRSFLWLFSFICLVICLFSVRQVRLLNETELARQYQSQVLPDPGLLIEMKYPGAGRVESFYAQQINLNSENFKPFHSEKFHAELSGFLAIPKSGFYTFKLASDDTSRMFLNGIRILEIPGIHPLAAAQKKLYLHKGKHYFTIFYDNVLGKADLQLFMGKNSRELSIIGKDSLFLSKQRLPITEKQVLPPSPSLISNSLAGKILTSSQWGGLSFILFLLTFAAALYFRKLKKAAKQPQTWGALGLVGLALSLKLFYYWQHLSLRIEGIQYGGDYYHYLLLPLEFVVKGEFISLNCGNLALMIPLVGLFYKLFGFFPGIHYVSYFLILLSSFAILFPWFLVRQTALGWIGLAGSAFLAVHPLLAGISIPSVSTAYLGFMITGLALLLSLRALLNNSLSDYILAGLSLALLMMTRTVFIPWAFVMMLAMLVLSRRRLRALGGAASFFLLAAGYEWLAQKELLRRGIDIDSYFYFFIHDGVGNSIFHRMNELPHEWWNLLLWLPHHFKNYLEIFIQTVLPLSDSFIVLKALICAAIAASFIILLFKSFRIGLFLTGSFFVYFFEISSYHVHERMLIPLVCLCAFALVLALNKFQARKSSALTLFCLSLLGMILVFTQAKDYLAFQKEEKDFYQWVKKRIPEKSILFADIKTDPWKAFKQLNQPVFYNAPKSPILVVSREVVPVRRVILLAQQLESQTENPDIAALKVLEKKGYHYLVMNRQFAEKLEKYKLKVVNIEQYPENNKWGLWKVQMENEESEPVEIGEKFLQYWEKGSKES